MLKTVTLHPDRRVGALPPLKENISRLFQVLNSIFTHIIH